MNITTKSPSKVKFIENCKPKRVVSFCVSPDLREKTSYLSGRYIYYEGYTTTALPSTIIELFLKYILTYPCVIKYFCLPHSSLQQIFIYCWLKWMLIKDWMNEVTSKLPLWWADNMIPPFYFPLYIGFRELFPNWFKFIFAFCQPVRVKLQFAKDWGSERARVRERARETW